MIRRMVVFDTAVWLAGSKEETAVWLNEIW